jgi:hypothetical protein
MNKTSKKEFSYRKLSIIWYDYEKNCMLFMKYQFKKKNHVFKFMFIYIANESSSSSGLSSISKRVKLKHNNVFVNKLVNNVAQYIYIYLILDCVTL